VDLLRDPLVLDASGAVPAIDVVIREGAAALTGTVLSRDQPSSGVIVVFAPGHRTPSFAFAGPDGSFNAGILAPGTYRVIAVENYSSIDFDNPSVLKAISARALEITLTPKQSANIRLQLTAVEE